MAEALGDKIEEDADRLRVGMAPNYAELTGPYLGLVALERRAGKPWEEAQAAYLAEAVRQGRSKTHRRDIVSIL